MRANTLAEQWPSQRMTISGWVKPMAIGVGQRQEAL